MKVSTKGKKEDGDLKEKGFLPLFTKFKEGKWHINKSKSLEWMDVDIKTREFDISINNIPKLAKIGDY